MNAPRSGCPINLTGSLRAIRLHTPQAFRQTQPSWRGPALGEQGLQDAAGARSTPEMQGKLRVALASLTTSDGTETRRPGQQ
jgi:hypothetical protein